MGVPVKTSKKQTASGKGGAKVNKSYNKNNNNKNNNNKNNNNKNNNNKNNNNKDGKSKVVAISYGV